MKIEIKNVTKTIKENVILSNINLLMTSGNIYGLYGHNGSGKTMLLKSICGLIKIDSGFIKVDGKEIGKDIDFPESIGAIIETPGFFKFYSGYENLKTLAQIKNKIGENDIKKALISVGLNPEDKREVAKYSLGMKQRLALAQALMEQPKLLVLDEPTNALDENGVKTFHELIKKEKEKGTLVILASHNKDDINILADVKLKMDNGRLKLVEE